MADSDLSAHLSLLDVDDDENSDGRNVDEILEATLEEAADPPGTEEGLKEYISRRHLEHLPVNL